MRHNLILKLDSNARTDRAATNRAIAINITYSDTGAGIDLNSLLVYHNDTDITSTLTKTSSSATGSATGVAGGNVFNAWISDAAGNQSFDSALLLIEDGAPPIITFISPLESQTATSGSLRSCLLRRISLRSPQPRVARGEG